MLRKQGRTEEAYAAILPMYAVHKGHYTTIAMFWVGVDMMKLRYQQRQLEEAYKIFKSLLRLYPTMDDKDLKGQSALMRASLLVFDHHPGFSMLDFISQWGITRLTDEDWTMEQGNGHPIPSIGMRIVGKVFKEVESKPTVDMALKAAPILAEALKHSPYNMHNQRYKAMVYRIMGKKIRQSIFTPTLSRTTDNPISFMNYQNSLMTSVTRLHFSVKLSPHNERKSSANVCVSPLQAYSLERIKAEPATN